jgi:hypothetical protein
MASESVPPTIESIPQQARLSEGARLVGVFVSPGKTFADIARNPRWWVAVLVASLLSGVYINLFSRRVGWEQMFRTQMERSTQLQNMTQQQREQIIAAQTSIAPFTAYATPLLTVAVNAVIAVVLLFLFDTILGADIGFKRFMAIVSYGLLPNAASAVLATIVLYLKPPEDFDLQNPLAFNVAAYLPADAAGWMRGLGQTLDLFSFWCIGLLAIGVSAASRKISTGKAVGVILFPWLLWVLVRTGLGALQQ